MDPLRTAHRNSDEQAKIQKIILSRSSKSAPQTLEDGQFPNPPPLFISGGSPDAHGAKAARTLKQALTALEVSADVLDFARKIPERRENLTALVSKSAAASNSSGAPSSSLSSTSTPSASPLASVFDFKSEARYKKYTTRKTRKELPGYIAATIISALGAEGIIQLILDAKDPDSPKIKDDDDETLPSTLEQHFWTYLQATAKATGPNTPNPIALTQVVGLVNRTFEGGKVGAFQYQYDLKVYIVTIEMDRTRLQNLVKKDGNVMEQADVNFGIFPQRAGFNTKAFEAIRDSYDGGLRALVGKDLNQHGASLIREAEVIWPPTTAKQGREAHQGRVRGL